MIVIHHNDPDGCLSARIIKEEYKNIFDNVMGFFAGLVTCQNVSFIETNYGQEIDFSQIHPDETVYVVDFSLDCKQMRVLSIITKNIVWIDHHVGALKKQEEYKNVLGMDEIKGLRDFENKYAACELCWHYFNGAVNIPDFIKYVGDYDKWKFEYGSHTKWFFEGLKLYRTRPSGQVWTKLFCKETRQNLTNEILEKGKTCINYRDQIMKEYRSRFAFEVVFEGLEALAMNIQNFGSPAFGEEGKDKDLCIAFAMIRPNKNTIMWQFSLYSDTVDCNKLAQKYGGGGHEGAAGFRLTYLPF
jgi:oligoribonuclease NrnB/cAMP/cGMP phosphodiesterase (DHH superfamily)